MPRLKVLFVASECVPFAKTGGLADVAGRAPRSRSPQRGHDVRVVLPALPRHEEAPGRAPPRAARRARRARRGVVRRLRGALRASSDARRLPPRARRALRPRRHLRRRARRLRRQPRALRPALARRAPRSASYLGFTPDVVHVHDWQTRARPRLPATRSRRRAPVGAGRDACSPSTTWATRAGSPKAELYQTGLGWDEFLARGLEAFDRVNLLKGGIYHATLVTTVSPRYAREIQTPEGGEGLDGVLRDRGGDVIGVLNGIDDEVWNPESDPLHRRALRRRRPRRARPRARPRSSARWACPSEPDVPLVGLVSRFAHQKGIDVFAGGARRHPLARRAGRRARLRRGAGPRRSSPRLSALAPALPRVHRDERGRSPTGSRPARTSS